MSGGINHSQRSPLRRCLSAVSSLSNVKCSQIYKVGCLSRVGPVPYSLLAFTIIRKSFGFMHPTLYILNSCVDSFLLFQQRLANSRHLTILQVATATLLIRDVLDRYSMEWRQSVPQIALEFRTKSIETDLYTPKSKQYQIL